MRASIKSIEHFNNYIERQPKRIARFDEKIKGGEVAQDNLASIYRKQFIIAFNILVATYSRGDDVSSIRAQFPALIAAMEKGWKDDKGISSDKYKFDEYVLMLQMLSLGVLLDVTDIEFGKIINVLDESGCKDKLFEFIICYKLKNRDAATKMMYETAYKPLLAIIQNTDKDSATTDLKAFIDKKWYAGMKNVYWYDNHRSRHDSFFGYWSFETAAIAKIMDLDIDRLKNNPYFPTDMT